MIRRVLSVDFDYFVDAGRKERDVMFPAGADKKDAEDIKRMWEARYLAYPHLSEIGVTGDYGAFLETLGRLSFRKVISAESHGDIARLWPEIPRGERIELVNVDFHHDFYVSGGERIDCANWLRRLTEERPDTSVLWIRRDESDTSSLSGEFAYPSSVKFDVRGEFDYAFICFSPEWTPPHLRAEFEVMVGAARRLGETEDKKNDRM